MPRLKLVEKRLVELAVVLKKLVVVALVPVAVVNVKFWRVVEALKRAWALTVSVSEAASPKVVESCTVRLPAIVVAPCEVEPARTRLFA